MFFSVPIHDTGCKDSIFFGNATIKIKQNASLVFL